MTDVSHSAPRTRKPNAPNQPAPDAQQPQQGSQSSLRNLFGFVPSGIDNAAELPRPDAQARARMLYEFCISTDRNVPESVHSVFIIAEHYAADNPTELKNPETINGIPTFFNSLSNKDKSTFCYNQVTESLSAIALPVTIDSLLATRRINPRDPGSSFAGRFVQRVTR